MWININDKLYNLDNALKIFITDKIMDNYEEKELGYWVLKIDFPGKNNTYSIKMNNKNEAQEVLDIISKSIPGIINIK
jgi:hypothetical protein